MYALALALRDVADWIARIAQAAISLIFGSALLLAFVNIIILWITGGWLGRFMNPAVAVATFVWIFLTFVAFHIGTGLAVKAGLIIYRETRRFMMGFIIIESATGLFFYLVPIPIYLIFPLLIAISMWYFSSEMMDRKFDWNNFRKPAIWACGIILTVGLIISFGFFDRRDVQDPSRVAPYVKNEVSPYIKGQAKGAAEEIGKIFKKSPPADDKEIAQLPRTRPAPAPATTGHPIRVPDRPITLGYNERIAITIDSPNYTWAQWVSVDQYGNRHQLRLPLGDRVVGLENDREPDKVYSVQVEFAPGTVLNDVSFRKERLTREKTPLS